MNGRKGHDDVRLPKQLDVRDERLRFKKVLKNKGLQYTDEWLVVYG
jgi:hypothetical protein